MTTLTLDVTPQFPRSDWTYSASTGLTATTDSINRGVTYALDLDNLPTGTPVNGADYRIFVDASGTHKKELVGDVAFTTLPQIGAYSLLGNPTASTGDITAVTLTAADLIYSGTALALAPTAVVAGVYTNPTVTVDATGRITAATAGAADSFRQRVYNGGFEVWQRTTSLALAASTTAVASIYAADRWSMETGANQACVVSRQTGLTTKSQYCARVQRNNAQTGTGVLRFQQWFETTDAIALRGRTLTLSMSLRAGANLSNNILVVRLYTGTGAEGRRTIGGGAWTGELTPINATQTITTTATTYTFTSTALGTNITQLAIAIEFTPVGTASANDYFEIDDVQLDEGIAATSFSPTPFADELNTCMRYYEKSYSYGVAPGTASTTGTAIIGPTQSGATSTSHVQYIFAVRKRSDSITVTSYNPNSGTAAQICDNALTASSATQTTLSNGSASYVNSGSVFAANSRAFGHFTAEAEL